MNEHSIKQAWRRHVEDLPIRPDEVDALTMQVPYELVTAASTDPEREINDADSTVDLPNGLTIGWEEPKYLPDGTCESEFHISITKNNETRMKGFLAQASPNEPPAVSHPQDPEATVVWKKAHGPQKAWMLANLRAQVVDFISNN